MEYRYKSTFTSIASVHAPSEDEFKVAKASLEPLRKLLPPGVDPEENPDLLYISAEGAVAGLVNRNGDGITKQAAIAANRSSLNKYINAQHDRDQVIGVVLYPALTKRDTREIVTEEQAAAMEEPFDMSFAGVLWKTVAPMIAKYIVQQGASIGKDVLSMSWEIAFNTYSIGVGSKTISEARIVKADDSTFETYDKMLRQNGGEGKDPSGQAVYRIIDGDAIVLGFGVVVNPAAEVKGILPIEKIAVEPTPMSAAAVTIAWEVVAKDAVTIPDGQYDAIYYGYILEIESKTIAMKNGVRNTREHSPLYVAEVKNGRIYLSYKAETLALVQSATEDATTAIAVLSQKNEEKTITSSAIGVTLNTANSMKIETIEQLESALGKHEAAAAAVDFVKAIHDASEKFAQDARAKEDLLKNADEAKAASEKLAKDLKESLDKVNKTLAEVQASQEAAVANQKFQERMASFDEQFDLDDEDRKLIASDIKDLNDDAFSAYAKKQSKLMCGKAKKKAPAAPAPVKTMPDDDNDADAAKAAEEAKAAEVAKLALASVKEIDGQGKLPNAVVVSEDLKTAMETAFAGSVKIDGETVAERKAKKSKK